MTVESRGERCPVCGRYVDVDGDSTWYVPGGGDPVVYACCSEACADAYAIAHPDAYGVPS